jgi:hypothetical protein
MTAEEVTSHISNFQIEKLNAFEGRLTVSYRHLVCNIIFDPCSMSVMLSFHHGNDIHRGTKSQSHVLFRPYKWFFLWIFLPLCFFRHHVAESLQGGFVGKSASHKTVKIHHFTSSSSTSDNYDERASSADPVSLPDNAPSWQDLRKRILDTPTGARLQTEQANRAVGLGPPHTDALLRLFSENANDVRVTLYRDQAGESTDKFV